MSNSGTYSILYIQENGVYTPIGCLTNNDFEDSSEVIQTTTRDNLDGWSTSRPIKQSYIISFSGVIDITKPIDKIGFRKIQTLKRDRTKINWRIENSKGDDVDYGEGYITNISKNDPLDDFIQFNGTITGYSKPLIMEGNLYIDSDYIDDYYE